VPAIDIAEVGAGGGSVAGIDAGGLLHVGPESVGAHPGPACYQLGNERPTVTDANMVLGLLNPVALAGGSLKVDPALSHSAIEQHIAARLGLSVVDAAHGIRHVANVNMARAIRAVTVERGRDPREMTLIAFGGGGPVHAVDVARLLGIKRVIAPVMAGVFCSAGMLAADAGHDFLRSVLRRMDGCDPAGLEAVAESLRRQGLVSLAAEGYPQSTVAFTLKVDLRYVGQSSELTVPLRGERFDAAALAALKDDFQRAYRDTFGYSNDEPLELVNLRLSARGRREQRLDFARIRMGGAALAGSSGSRMVSFARGSAPVSTPVLARADMPVSPIAGPMIVESYDTTVVVPPDVLARADAVGNIILDLQDAAGTPTEAGQ